MTPAVRVSPDWLEQREAADAAARAVGLVDALRPRLPAGPLVVHDLGCGTGSMTRWLAPLLPGPQHWVLHDHDPDLLDLAVDRAGDVLAADGSAVTAVALRGDITRLDAADLAGASLVTGSALLDVLTDAEVRRVVRACAGAGCPVLLALTVVGRVALAPPEPLDAVIAAAFDDHQRRPARGSRLLGPGALQAAAGMFRAAGHDVLVGASPWRLGAGAADLAAAWFAGWVAAAREVRPELGPVLELYTRRRLREAAEGRLAVTVHHADLLAVPRPRPAAA